MAAWKRWTAWTIACALVVFLAFRAYYYLTDDFRLSNITHSLPYQQEWAIHQPDNKLVDEVLKERFTYLDKGAQSYVFMSEDGKYILKFFKFKHLRPNLFFDTLASYGLFQGYHKKLVARKARKLWGVFHAYKLAYDVDQEGSGVFFIQLNTEGNPPREVKIKDKLGLERTIDLQHLTFILQYRGEPLRTVLGDLLKEKKVDLATNKIDQIFDLYASEYSKGVFDHDHGVMRNVGFAGDKPIHLDVGKLMLDEKMKNKQTAKLDALLVAAPIKKWVKDNYPEYSSQIDAAIDRKISSLYD